MTFREELLRTLASPEFNIDNNTVAEGFAQVIRGETVRRKYKTDSHGNKVLVEEVRMITPKDAMTGAMIYDAMTGGTLGISPEQYRQLSGDEQKVVHRRLTVDTRIIANSDDDSKPEPE